MTFFGDGQSALDALDSDVDIVVSDMRMPGLDGPELLARVRHSFPATVRLGLSGYSEGQAILRGLPAIHRFFAKPCQSQDLVAALESILEAKSRLPAAVQEAVAGISSLPSRPEALEDLRQELSMPRPRLPRIAEIASGDLAVAVKVWHLVHSDVFGLNQRVPQLEQACQRLGAQRLRDVFGCFSESLVVDPDWLMELALQSQRVSVLAAELGRAHGLTDRALQETAMAGTLQGLSSLMARAVLGPEHSQQASQAAAYLLTLWGMPPSVVEAVGHWSRPGELAPAAAAGPVTFVHLARHLVAGEQPDGDYLSRMGVKWDGHWENRNADGKPG
jgi:HD-like signal output (HDOD) protein/CheY-like chemotaxis protein